MSVGLKRGTVALEPHQPEWEEAARAAIYELKALLGGDIVDAQHVGSTAIRGIWAKPIIDIAVGVRNFDDMLSRNAELAAHGVIYRRQDHPGQHLYVRGDVENDFITHHIHVVIYGGAQWRDYLNLRDYLNCHPAEALQYSALKQRLLAQYPDRRAEYTAGKAAFVADILARARAWRCECAQ